jgi:tetratricopeptide (TPR) repeat protein
VADPLLVEWYRELPELKPGDDADLWSAQMHDALKAYRRRVRIRYSEGTLQRMLVDASPESRRAAVLALGLTGTFDSNAPLARMLHDEDELVAKTAGDALWEIWFRGGTDEAVLDLRRAMRLTDSRKALAAFDEVIRDWPEFAEAYNQRAIILFQTGDYSRSVTDCERTLRLNPFHFGAQAGMGQCFMKLRKFGAALHCFKMALEINPTLNHLDETIRALEQVVGGS